jgi:hypothetical protein
MTLILRRGSLQSNPVTVSNGKKGSVELQHVMHHHVSLTGNVGSPVRLMLKHLNLAVVNTGRPPADL